VSTPEIHVLTIAEARDKLGTLVQRAGLRGEVAVLSYRGEHAAVLVPLGIDAERMEEIRQHVRSLEE
jgi:hypothetical protein